MSKEQSWFQLAVWGDSIVHGGCDGEQGGWVNRLKVKLYTQGLGDHCFNLGIGGQNSAEVLGRLEHELDYRKAHIDHCVYAVGMNDLYSKGKQLSVEVYTQNLYDLVKKTRLANKRPWLCTISLCEHEGMAARREVFNQAIRQCCLETQAGLIDFSTLLVSEHLVDGVHPGGEGHRLMCEKAWNDMEVKTV